MRLSDWKFDYAGEPSDDVVMAAAYLEAKGLNFLTDFNVHNAVEKAEARMQIEKIAESQ